MLMNNPTLLLEIQIEATLENSSSGSSCSALEEKSVRYIQWQSFEVRKLRNYLEKFRCYACKLSKFIIYSLIKKINIIYYIDINFVISFTE